MYNYGNMIGRRRRPMKKSLYQIISAEQGYIGNAFAENTRAAIISFCKLNGIQLGQAMSIGLCGNVKTNCIPVFGYLRNCGRNSICPGDTIIESTVGLLRAIKTVR